MTSTSVINKDIELRKLPADYLNSVEEALETNEDWKRFMSLIPKSLENLASEHYEKKYNGEDIRLIENYAIETKVKCAKVLFVEWGTSGRVRPTLKTLLALLVKAEMFKAADAIAKMLGDPLPERPTDGPAAAIDLNVSNLLITDKITYQLKTTTREHFNKITNQKKLNNYHDIPSNIGNHDQSPGGHSSASDMIDFSKTIDYLPASDILNPKGETEDKFVKSNQTNNFQTSDSISDSETLQSHSDVTQSTPSHSFQSNNFYEQADIKDILADSNLIQFAFNDLAAVTNNFTDTLIGSGGFGDVFLGNYGPLCGLGFLAVKKLHKKQPLEVVTKMFSREVKLLSLLHHDNIVPILGFSIDGPSLCIVCEFIEGGSLKQKIAEKVLNKSQRMNIMVGAAEGLRYIHNTERPNLNTMPSKKSNFCHGDVKSDNILLTKDCIPKLCDFGLAKQFESTYMTENIIGTRFYMAPESLDGTVTQKSDVYSYGIVLLEILTGLFVVVNDNAGSMNIKSYLKENCVGGDITQYVDKVVCNWTEANSIYDVAKLCLTHETSERPAMDEICAQLQKI